MSFRLGEAAGLSALEVTAFGWLHDVIAGIAKNGHKKIVVVGVRGDNFPPPYREHPQLVFWDTGDISEVPASAGLVLVTRFVRHSGYDTLKAECDKRGIKFCSTPLGTGQIKALVEPVMANRPKPKTQTREADVSEVKQQVVGTTLKEFPRGMLAEFAHKHANTDATPVVFEIRRLVKLAADAGYTVSESSMTSAFYRVKSERSEPVPASTPPAKAQPVSSTGIMLEDDAELLRMVNDTIAALELIKQTISERSSNRAELRKLLQNI